MKGTHQATIEILTDFLEKNPGQRFGQALFSLGINEFADKKDPANKEHLLRDIYQDSDEKILARMIEAKMKIDG